MKITGESWLFFTQQYILISPVSQVTLTLRAKIAGKMQLRAAAREQSVFSSFQALETGKK